MDEHNLEQVPTLNNEQIGDNSPETAKEQGAVSGVEKISAQPEKESKPEGKSFEKEKSEVKISKPIADDSHAGLAAENTPAAIMKKREEAIDKILSEGLNDIFLSMPPQKQQEFQKKGEEK